MSIDNAHQKFFTTQKLNFFLSLFYLIHPGEGFKLIAPSCFVGFLKTKWWLLKAPNLLSVTLMDLFLLHHEQTVLQNLVCLHYIFYTRF